MRQSRYGLPTNDSSRRHGTPRRLGPQIGDRDDDLIEQYAVIFDALPAIKINQKNEVIDGWHRVRAAERATRTEIAFVVETKSDDDLSDRMWESNLKNDIQYTRDQRKTQGLKLHERGLPAKVIATRVGVNASSVCSWTQEHHERIKQERYSEIQRLREEGMTLQENAGKVDMPLSTVARIAQISQMRKTGNEPETEAEPAIEIGEIETEGERESEAESATDTPSADKKADTSEPEP